MLKRQDSMHEVWIQAIAQYLQSRDWRAFVAGIKEQNCGLFDLQDEAKEADTGVRAYYTIEQHRVWEECRSMGGALLEAALTEDGLGGTTDAFFKACEEQSERRQVLAIMEQLDWLDSFIAFSEMILEHAERREVEEDQMELRCGVALGGAALAEARAAAETAATAPAPAAAVLPPITTAAEAQEGSGGCGGGAGGTLAGASRGAAPSSSLASLKHVDLRIDVGSSPSGGGTAAAAADQDWSSAEAAWRRTENSAPGPGGGVGGVVDGGAKTLVVWQQDKYSEDFDLALSDALRKSEETQRAEASRRAEVSALLQLREQQLPGTQRQRQAGETEEQEEEREAIAAVRRLSGTELELAHAARWSRADVLAWLEGQRSGRGGAGSKLAVVWETGEGLRAAFSDVDGETLLELSAADLVGEKGVPRYHVPKVMRVINEVRAGCGMELAALSPPVPARAAAEEEGGGGGGGGGGGRRVRVWVKGEQIGQGAFGSVFVGLDEENADMIAVKEVQLVGLREHEAAALQKEIALMTGLHHPNIVRYLGTERCADSADAAAAPGAGVLRIFMEWVAGGSLVTVLQKFGTLPPRVVQLYTRQLLHGLLYLHENAIVHQDIKPANVLVSHAGVVKLADFGCARRLRRRDTSTTTTPKNAGGGGGGGGGDGGSELVEDTPAPQGTPFFMAPEVVMQKAQGTAADIYSAGGTVLQMVTGKPPWKDVVGSGANAMTILYTIAHARGPPPLPRIAGGAQASKGAEEEEDEDEEKEEGSGERNRNHGAVLDGAPSVTAELHAFLTDCFAFESSKRPSAEQLLAHPFLAAPVHVQLAAAAAPADGALRRPAGNGAVPPASAASAGAGEATVAAAAAAGVAIEDADTVEMGQATRVANAAADAVQASHARKLPRAVLSRDCSSGDYDSVADTAVLVTDMNSPALLDDMTFTAVDGDETVVDDLESINTFLVGESMHKTQSFRLLSSAFAAADANPRPANPFARSNMQTTEAAMARSASQEKYPLRAKEGPQQASEAGGDDGEQKQFG